MHCPPKPDDYDDIMRAFSTDMECSLDLPEGISRNTVQLVIVGSHLMRLERLERWLREYRMEIAGSYDLAALAVNVSMPSNSETGWERED